MVGSIQPIEKIAQLTRDNDAIFLVDAAQSLGHLPVDVERYGIDILAGSGHKGLLGPPGTGILYVSPDVTLQSVMEGGTGSRSESSQQPAIYPDFLESGTQNVPGIAGLGAGLQYLLGKDIREILFGDYRIIYRKREEVIEIITIYHGARLFDPKSIK